MSGCDPFTVEGIAMDSMHTCSSSVMLPRCVLSRRISNNYLIQLPSFQYITEKTDTGVTSLLTLTLHMSYFLYREKNQV